MESFIPYRDSVLTWLLRENLGMKRKKPQLLPLFQLMHCFISLLFRRKLSHCHGSCPQPCWYQLWWDPQHPQVSKTRLQLKVIVGVNHCLKQSLSLQVRRPCQTDPLQRRYQWGPQQPAGARAQRGSGSPQRPAVRAGSGRHHREWVFTQGNASLSDWGRRCGRTQARF